MLNIENKSTLDSTPKWVVILPQSLMRLTWLKNIAIQSSQHED